MDKHLFINAESQKYSLEDASTSRTLFRQMLKRKTSLLYSMSKVAQRGNIRKI